MAFFALFGPFRAIFVVGVKFKTFLEPIYVNNLTLGLEVQPYLFVFNFAAFGASFVLFWALWGYFMALWDYFQGWDQGQN